MKPDACKISVPAVQGIQGGYLVFIAQLPIPVAARILHFEDAATGDEGQDEFDRPEDRAQRKLNKSRARKIKEYVIKDIQGYFLPPLIVSIDGETEFEPASEVQRDAGTLHIDAGARFVINDGQHRKVGLHKALLEADKKVQQELRDESIPVMFLPDISLKRSQYVFRTINANSSKPPGSLNILYDHKDLSSVFTKEVVEAIPLLKNFTEKETTTVSSKNKNLFALTWLHSAIERMKPGRDKEIDKRYCIGFWLTLSHTIPEWQQVSQKQLTAREVREFYLCSHAIAIRVFGEIGAAIAHDFCEKPEELREFLKPLGEIDWSKANPDWEGRVLTPDGKVLTKTDNFKRLVIYLKTRLSVLLSKDEESLEGKYSSLPERDVPSAAVTGQRGLLMPKTNGSMPQVTHIEQVVEAAPPATTTRSRRSSTSKKSKEQKNG